MHFAGFPGTDCDSGPPKCNRCVILHESELTSGFRPIGCVSRLGCPPGLLLGGRIGKTVRIRRGPAAVTGDERCNRPLRTTIRVNEVSPRPWEGAVSRTIRKPEDLPGCRFDCRSFEDEDAGFSNDGPKGRSCFFAVHDSLFVSDCSLTECGCRGSSHHRLVRRASHHVRP